MTNRKIIEEIIKLKNLKPSEVYKKCGMNRKSFWFMLSKDGNMIYSIQEKFCKALELKVIACKGKRKVDLYPSDKGIPYILMEEEGLKEKEVLEYMNVSLNRLRECKKVNKLKTERYLELLEGLGYMMFIVDNEKEYWVSYD